MNEMVTVQTESAYNYFCQDAIVLCLDVDGGFVGLLRGHRLHERLDDRKRKTRTISSKTSPAVKDSPCFFFHEAIPPSVMVGLIAGIAKCERAFRRAETWMSDGKASANWGMKSERRSRSQTHDDTGCGRGGMPWWCAVRSMTGSGLYGAKTRPNPEFYAVRPGAARTANSSSSRTNAAAGQWCIRARRPHACELGWDTAVRRICWWCFPRCYLRIHCDI